MANSVLVFAEQRNGTFRGSTFEAVCEGKRIAGLLGTDMVAAVLGDSLGNMADVLTSYGADRVVVADNERLAFYSTEGYARVLADIARGLAPSVLLLSATAMGKDLAPRVAVQLKTGVITECTALDVTDGRIVATRPVYAGKALIKTMLVTDPQILTLRPKLFPAGEPASAGEAQAEQVDVQLAAETIRTRMVEFQARGGDRPELTEADIIVSGGRGMGDADKFSVIEDLADVLGAAVGASRSAVDAGWRPHPDQVGQTGKTVAPSLYIACGISGAIQHLAGMTSSKCIVAINKNPDAPIFKVATYGIVGNLFDVVPALTEELKKIQS